MIRRWAGTIAFLVATGLVMQEQAACAEEVKLPAGVEEVLQWFPVDTETLSVAQGPFRLVPLEVRQVDFVELVQSQPVFLIRQFFEETMGKKLQGEKIVLAVEGGRRFRAPGSKGIMRFEGCEILRFDERAHEVVRKVFRECAEGAESTILLAGKKVLTFKKTEQENDWNLYLSLPRNGILLCATDREYLKVVLERMERPAEGRALPAELPEWEHVNVKAPVWAIRHYSRETAANDPSSPLRDKAFANLPDPKAIGITYSLEQESTGALVHYLSGAPDASDLARKRWHHPGEGLRAEVKPLAPGVVEITSQYRNEEGQYKVFLLLLATVGHGLDE